MSSLVRSKATGVARACLLTLLATPLALQPAVAQQGRSARIAGALDQASAPVVYRGHFITLDSLAPHAEAVLVRDGRIVAIGSVAHADSAAGPGVRQVALPGVVVPGLADAHVHVAMLGDVLETIDLRGASKREVLARVAAAARGVPAGQWIHGGGWDQSFWTPPDYPTAIELDAASGGRPVLLERIDGHALWANTRAMQLAGLTRTTAEPPGGRIVRDAIGAPSGVFVDDAMALIRRVVPEPSRAHRMRRLRRALDRYSRWGLTSVHDAGIDQGDLDAYHALVRAGPLPVRVYAMFAATDPSLAALLAAGPELGSGGGTFTLRTVKVVDDGALGSRGARLSSPYHDEASERGLDLDPNGRLDSIIVRGLARGFQIAVHAIGDASNHDVLAAFSRAGPSARATRFRLEHVSMLRDEDVPRLAALGVIASMQPVFVGEYSRFAEARVGAARLPWVYRTRDVFESGAVVATGTDFPASDTGDPVATLYSMVTRRGYDGQPEGGWLPDQRVSVDVALRSMTMGAAYAAFEEDVGGMLRVGRRADFTVLSADPYAVDPAQLRSLEVLRTIVGGRTTYQR
ncbi:MAG: amidohydrolase [Gemmatimonadota bacterium]